MNWGSPKQRNHTLIFSLLVLPFESTLFFVVQFLQFYREAQRNIHQFGDTPTGQPIILGAPMCLSLGTMIEPVIAPLF